MSPVRGSRAASSLLSRLLVRLHGERWVPPSVLLRVLRVAWGHGLVDRAPSVDGLWWHDAEGTAYGADLLRGDDAPPRLVVVWLHGGGWFFGSRQGSTPYVARLCGDGVVGLVVDYPLAPERRHPAPLRDLAAALPGLLERAGLGTCPVVLAGNSAGASYAVALGRLATDERYAARLRIAPPLPAGRLVGLVLCSGVFSPVATRVADRWFTAVLAAASWSMARSRRWWDSAFARDLEALDAGRLPSTLLLSATNDPAHRTQAVPFLAALRDNGTPVDAWFSDDPDAGHEFHARPDSPSGRASLEQVRAFLAHVG